MTTYKELLAKLGGASRLVRNVDRNKYESQYILGILVVLLSALYINVLYFNIDGELVNMKIEYFILPVIYYLLFIPLNSFLLSLMTNLHFSGGKFPNIRYFFIFLGRLLLIVFNICLIYYTSLSGLNINLVVAIVICFCIVEMLPYLIKMYRSQTPYDYLFQIEKKKETEIYQSKLDQYKEELNQISSGNVSTNDKTEYSNIKDGVNQNIFISRIEVTNIRCFDNFKLKLENENSIAGMLTTIIGDNSSGKSTILKAICLGIADESGSIGLIKAEKGKFIRRGSKKGEIKITLKDYLSNNECIIYTAITEDDVSKEEIVRKDFDDPNLIYSKTFICAYGSHRSKSSDQSIGFYSKYEATKHLFDKEDKLLNPELILLRQSNSAQRKILNTLHSISDSKKFTSSFSITDQGIEINGFKIDSSSDGFVSTLNWVLDLYGRAIAFGYLRQSSDLAGIIIIDEIDMHLHPKWQKTVVNNLKRTFPKLQFIITTHSPFVVQSLRANEIYNLEENNIDQHPNSMSIEQNALFMGVGSSNSSSFDQKEKVALEYLKILKKDSPQNDLKKLDELIATATDPVFKAKLKLERLTKVGKE